MGISDLDEVLNISYLIKSMQENDVESDNYQLPVVAKPRRTRQAEIPVRRDYQLLIPNYQLLITYLTQ